MVGTVITCANGILIRKVEAAQLVGVLGLAIEMTQDVIESEEPHGRERTKEELAMYHKLSGQIGRWKKLQEALMKAHDQVRA
jgi:hypothetical protein